MTTSPSFAPEDLAPVSPLAATVVADLFRAHPSLSTRSDVQLAILGVTYRYIDELRDLAAIAPNLTEVEVCRALLFLENTARPLPSAPDATAADLVAAVREALRSRRTPYAETAARAFEHAIARIVHAARRAKAATMRRASL